MPPTTCRAVSGSAGASPTGGEIPSHDAYLAEISQNHARKSGFWKRMQDIGMAQSG